MKTVNLLKSEDESFAAAAEKCKAGALGRQKGDWLLVIAVTVNTALHKAAHCVIGDTRWSSDGRALC